MALGINNIYTWVYGYQFMYSVEVHVYVHVYMYLKSRVNGRNDTFMSAQCTCTSTVSILNSIFGIVMLVFIYT